MEIGEEKDMTLNTELRRLNQFDSACIAEKFQMKI